MNITSFSRKLLSSCLACAAGLGIAFAASSGHALPKPKKLGPVGPAVKAPPQSCGDKHQQCLEVCADVDSQLDQVCGKLTGTQGEQCDDFQDDILHACNSDCDEKHCKA